MPETTNRKRKRHPATARPGTRRKSLNVDQHKLDRLINLTGTGAETEVVDQELELLRFQEESMAGLRKLAGRGHEIENLFDPHLDP
jgi:hypothetical protein